MFYQRYCWRIKETHLPLTGVSKFGLWKVSIICFVSLSHLGSIRRFVYALVFTIILNTKSHMKKRKICNGNKLFKSLLLGDGIWAMWLGIRGCIQEWNSCLLNFPKTFVPHSFLRPGQSTQVAFSVLRWLYKQWDTNINVQQVYIWQYE